MTAYLYETSIECKLPTIGTIRYNSDNFPDLQKIKEYHKSIMGANEQNDLLYDMALNTLDDIIAAIDLSLILEKFNTTEAPIIRHQEYFKFESSHILVSIYRFSVIQRMPCTTFSIFG